MKNKLKEQVYKKIEETWPDQVQFLRSLIAQKSTLLHETDMQSAMARKMRQLQLAVDMFDIDIHKISNMPGYCPCDWTYRNRPVVVGTWRGDSSSGRSLVINGHADVVEAEAEHLWTYEPWRGTVVGDRLYGRGSSDMKCGLSAMIYAVAALKDLGLQPAGDVILQSVIEEEASGNGTLACIERGYLGDAAFIAECTGSRLMTATVGSLWCRLVIEGKSGHAAVGNMTANAIEEAYKIIQVLKKLEESWNREKPPLYQGIEHPINFNVGKIEGGSWPSSVPALCEFHVRFGIYPGQDPINAEKEIEAYVLGALAKDPWLSGNPPRFYWYAHRNRGFSIEPKGDFYDILRGNHKAVHRQELQELIETGGNDMKHWALYSNIPVVMYGGTGGNLHAADEYVELPSILSMTKVIAGAVIDWCEVH